MNTLLGAILFILVAQITLTIIAMWRIVRVYQQFQVFVRPPAADQPSPLASVVQVGADMMGRALVARLKTTFMGQESGTTRAAAAVTGDIAQDMAESHPLISGILGSFPTLRKSIRRNPQLLDLALNALSRRAVGGAPPSGGNGKTDEPQFRL